MIQGFYITTEDVMGIKTHPNGWSGIIKKNTPIMLTGFDEYGMEFIDGGSFRDGLREFRLEKPCKIKEAASCQYCGHIIPTQDIQEHLNIDENCKRIREMIISREQNNLVSNDVCRSCKNLQDFIDLMKDEFLRIKSITNNTEIHGLCDRAITNIKQNVSVIEQRDQLERELMDEKEKVRIRDLALENLAIEKNNGYIAGAQHTARDWIEQAQQKLFTSK